MKKILPRILAVALVFGMTVVGCDTGTTSGGGGVSAQMATYTAVLGSDTYTLKIMENKARYTAQSRDAYELTITPEGKKSSGTVFSVSGGVLTLLPKDAATNETFTATVLGNSLTALNGWILWTDNTMSEGPGAFTGGSGPGGPSGGGSTWTAVTNSSYNGPTEHIYTIAYGNGRFVAGGTGVNNGNLYGKIATSSDDGVTWTETRDSPFYMDASGYGISQIVYGNGKFVARGGDNGTKMAYSSDGITWTATNNTLGWSPKYIVSGNSNFVAVIIGGNKIAYSSDGAIWTAVTAPFKNEYFDGSIDAIAYGNNMFIALGRIQVGGSISSVGNVIKISTSTDGVNWTPLTDTNLTVGSLGGIDATSIKAITYGNNKFVAADNNGRMATSSDGVTWTTVSNTTFGTKAITTIAYGNNKFVAGGADGQMATSTDGATWTADTGWNAVTRDTLGTSQINAIALGNGRFVAGGSRGHMAYWNIN